MTADAIPEIRAGMTRARRWVVRLNRRGPATGTVTRESARVLLATPTNLTELTPEAAVELGDALRAAGGVARPRLRAAEPSREQAPDPRPTPDEPPQVSATEVRGMAMRLGRLASALETRGGQ